MYVVASFQFSDGLETAVAELENSGVEKREILVIPLDKRTENPNMFDTIYSSDGKSLVDFAAVLGCIFMLLGGVYGFLLPVGPIFGALIGLVGGFSSGFACDYFYTKRKHRALLHKTNLTEVFLLVQCTQEQEEKIKTILWNQFALGIATISPMPPKVL
ncbi:hypothetical protein SAMN05421736_11233 [Evansella caseinilytica]|uniref:Uncharacterized protein n=1 Tax=Evansella caseinilytica TaxID=1503961 RepID=A0A1H3SW96_9BACI|nr:hypothetical protein [Evansella caseinilytica]SDZ41399.1 hypothetical protein SAMN05421736_11233 [Evansella caseinilytica]